MTLPSHENDEEWWMLLRGLGMWARTLGFAGSEMSQIIDSEMHAAPARWRGRNTVTSWQPMFGETSSAPITFAADGLASGISTIETLRCEATLQSGSGAPSG